MSFTQSTSWEFNLSINSNTPRIILILFLLSMLLKHVFDTSISTLYNHVLPTSQPIPTHLANNSHPTNSTSPFKTSPVIHTMPIKNKPLIFISLHLSVLDSSSKTSSRNTPLFIFSKHMFDPTSVELFCSFLLFQLNHHHLQTFIPCLQELKMYHKTQSSFCQSYII